VQTQHDDQEIQQAQLHAQRMVDSLRRDLDAQAKLRDDDARAQETMLRANAGNSPTGDITAAARIAQLHQQLSQQQLADTETLYSAQSAALDAALTKAIARYGEDQANYQSLLDAKLQADQQYAAQKSQIESQARLQSIQDILAVGRPIDPTSMGP
jgi:U3 small nucleolar RNA-associated protein 14